MMQKKDRIAIIISQSGLSMILFFCYNVREHFEWQEGIFMQKTIFGLKQILEVPGKTINPVLNSGARALSSDAKKVWACKN